MGVTEYTYEVPEGYTQGRARFLAFLMTLGVLGMLWGFCAWMGGLAVVPALALFLGGALALGYGVWKSPRT